AVPAPPAILSASNQSSQPSLMNRPVEMSSGWEDRGSSQPGAELLGCAWPTQHPPCMWSNSLPCIKLKKKPLPLTEEAPSGCPVPDRGGGGEGFARHTRTPWSTSWPSSPSQAFLGRCHREMIAGFHAAFPLHSTERTPSARSNDEGRIRR